jgi:hypothetical protein
MSTPEPYRIRLRGPWEVTLIDPAGAAEPFRYAYIPAAWTELFGDRPGTAVFRRHFNRSPGVEPDDQVWIVLPAAPGQVEFQINGHPLEPGESSRESLAFDVTPHIQEFNVLEVRIADDPADHPGSPAGLWDTVLLEIRAGRDPRSP